MSVRTRSRTTRPLRSTAKSLDGDSDIGGALWDAGELLVSRLVTSAESNPKQLRRIRAPRDLHILRAPMADAISESDDDKRQSLDRSFVTAVSGSDDYLDKILDADGDENSPYNLDQALPHCDRPSQRE